MEITLSEGTIVFFGVVLGVIVGLCWMMESKLGKILKELESIRSEREGERSEREAEREEEAEQKKFDDFYRKKGFPHIFDEVRAAEFARQRSISLDDANSILSAADARFDDYQDGVKAVEAGERILAFIKGSRISEERERAHPKEGNKGAGQQQK